MFDWNGQKKIARLVGQHDADTCRVVFDTGLGVKQMIIRVKGIDGPEMNSRNEEERRHAVLARNEFLEVVAPGMFNRNGDYDQKEIVQKLADKVTLLTLELGGPDKYGRILATVMSADGINVGQRLIETGSVHAYNGKTKEPWHL